MKATVVLTGATGFIGSFVAKEFAAQGHAVVALVRPQSDIWRIAGVPGLEIVHGDAQAEATRLVAELSSLQPQVVVHCAWRGVGGADRSEAFQIEENVPATIRSVAFARAIGCRQWVGLGSQAEYGNLDRPLDEDAPLKPTTAYGKAKLAAGVAALGLCESFGLTGSWLRVFSTYGPLDNPSWFIPYVIGQYLAGQSPRLTKCEQVWDYLYVADAAAAVRAVVEKNASGTFNLGSGIPISLREVVERLQQELEVTGTQRYGDVAYRPDQVMHLQADISKLKGATGWTPATSLQDGLRATVAFERNRFVAEGARP